MAIVRIYIVVGDVCKKYMLLTYVCNSDLLRVRGLL